jgi:hypothetical protein
MSKAIIGCPDRCNETNAGEMAIMIVRVIADAVMSRLLLVLLILMMGTVVCLLLARSPGGDVGTSRIERSLSTP